MWPSIRRWLAWHRLERAASLELRSRLRCLGWGYTAAGLQVWAEAVPWFAETAWLRLGLTDSPADDLRRADFILRCANNPIVCCHDMQRRPDGLIYLDFRLTPPFPNDHLLVLCWREYPLLSLAMPRLDLGGYLQSLSWRCGGVTMRCGRRAATARSFSRRSLRSLAATVVVASPHTLVPLARLQPMLRVQAQPDGRQWEIPIELGATQQLAQETVLVQPLPGLSAETTRWSLEYHAGGHRLHAETVHFVDAVTWERQVAVADACYVIQDANEGWVRQRDPPAGNRACVFGPCFVLQAPLGSAGLLPVGVYARTLQRSQTRLLRRESLLVADVPTVYVPGLFSRRELPPLASFELRCGSRLLAELAWSQTPQARLTAEGGFVPPGDFVWTEANETELLARLSRLSRRPPDDKRL